MRRKFQVIAAQILASVLCVGQIATVQAQVQETSEIQQEETVEASSRVNVHDPSICYGNGTYYVFGSHMADAKSSDLIQWEQIYRDYEDYDNNSIYGNVIENFAESFAWAGYKDGFNTGDTPAIWAPDVIWNKNYINSDGTKGAYMMYYCVTSSWKRSCIGYAVSKNIEGPYSYVDTIVYSGFTENGNYDTDGGPSTRNTKWDNDYLNLKELTELGAYNGGIEGVSSNWFTDDGGWNASYAPNAIDPTVFYDAKGNMYMVYGSFSGGIYMLELDKTTGQPIYPGVDGTDPVSGNYEDRYFGTHLAGGNHQSGEGPYIIYDASTKYYYLYESYGDLSKDYNMRVFRSKNPTGPYVDAMGNNAADSGSNNEKYGIKLMGNYQFSNQTGYRAAGHNSAFIDSDGSHYLVYHQRFTQKVTGTDHQLRVHQQFMNQEGWPVTAVYEYQGDKISHYTRSQVTGTYELINHGSNTSTEVNTSQTVVLEEDGTITGEVSGTWTMETGTDYDYVTLKIGDATYKGVFYKQKNEEENPGTVMTFTAIGDNNQSIWGSSTDVVYETPVVQEDSVLKGKTSYNKVVTAAAFTLDTTLETGDGALTYTTSNKNVAVVNQKGKVTLKGCGKAVITVTAAETTNYKKATRKITITVSPEKMAAPTVKPGKKSLKVSWKKAQSVTGYELQYSTSKKFTAKTTKTVTVKTAKTLKKDISGLKTKKTYYVRIRAYKKTDSGNIYGAYSTTRTIKVK